MGCLSCVYGAVLMGACANPGPSAEAPAPVEGVQSQGRVGGDSKVEVNPVEQVHSVEAPADPAEGNVETSETDATVEALLARTPSSVSVGVPTLGRLEAGVQLPSEAPGLRHHPGKRREAAFGSHALVAGLLRAAAKVRVAFGDDTWTTIGDLSLERGGDIEGHASHQNGRDVDVMFHLLDAAGQPRPGHPIPLDLRGEGTDYRDLSIAEDDLPVRLDAARTWAFVAALIEDAGFRIQRILVAEHLRALLLAQARRVAAPASTIDRFEAVTCQPKFPHDDHMHIRVFCSAEDRKLGCEDVWPIYPWQRQHLRRAGVQGPIKPAKKPRKTPAKVKSHEAARAEASAKAPLHAKVVAFLDRRKAWIAAPHPGRPYCK